MKTVLKITFISLLFFVMALQTNAQDEKKHSWPKHGWHLGDSSQVNEFSCAMENFNMSEFPFCKNKNKYNGHWAGFDFGINGYVTPAFDMNFNPDYPYMNMNTARSLMVNINPFELNVNLFRNKIGFTTGLGFQVSNYFFTDNFVLIQDSTALTAYKVQDAQGSPVTLETNKLVASYLNLPLFLEFQTNQYRRLNSFHITLGVIAGVRIGSYTKQKYNEEGGSYYLVDTDGNKVAAYSVDKEKVHDRGPYHLSPFKLDAALRVGWSHLNLFATYSLTKMFQKDQGPELYPYTVGISLMGW